MKLRLLLMLIGFYCVGFAQTEKKRLALVRLDNKYGFIDPAGREIIPLIYDDAGAWGNNLVPVNIGKYTPDYGPPKIYMDPGSLSPKGDAKVNEQYKPIEFKKPENGKWGYCNTLGQLVIPIQFTKATFFNEGMAGVKVDGKWGFIDIKGKLVVQPIYDTVGYFSQGLAMVAKDDAYGYINLKGEEVIKLQYVGAETFEKGYAIVYEKHEFKTTLQKSIGRLINLNGKMITDAKYDIRYNFSNGLISFTVPDGDYSYGLMNTSGQIIKQPVYREISDFYNGLAKVMVYKKDNVYDEYFSNYGYIDINGKELIKPSFALADDFNYGLATVARFDDKDDGIMDRALINTKGAFIIDYKYQQLTMLDANHFLVRVNKNEYQIEDMIINAQGKKIKSLNNKGLDNLGNGLFVIKNENNEPIGLVGLNKQITFDVAQNKNRNFVSYQFGLVRFHNVTSTYEERRELEEGIAKIKLGLLDLKGKVIIMPKYNEIANFELTASNP